jgi:gamma-glutamyltranspeptidase/glutathione hydrolase
VIDPIVSTVSTTGAIAVSPHHLAGRAALQIMAAGGNAADGAVAANAVLGTVLPTTCGMGGDLFALILGPESSAPAALNASGRGGSGLDAAAARAAGYERMPLDAPWSITVPGCVDGWIALAERFGELPLEDVLAPARRHATRGFQTSKELAAALERLAPRLTRRGSAEELYPDGRIPAAGEILQRPAYGRVLESVGREGRSALYAGPVGDAIVGATGGTITPEDLAARQARWVEPLAADVFGRRLWTLPPNSQGYLTAAACWLLQELDPRADPDDPAFHHAVIEAYRAVAWEADRIVADPEHTPLRPQELADPGRLRPRLEAIRQDSVADWSRREHDRGGTAYLCVVDGEGMAVSLIQSNYTGIGSGISAGDTGVWLHNRGAGFSLEPGHPNEAGGGKRPRHTLAPTLWTEEGRASLLLGARGGHAQPQYLTQMAALLHLAGLTPPDAQLIPRWSIGADGYVDVEAEAGDEVLEGLARRGHRVRRAGSPQPGWGPVSVISLDANGTRWGAADPRVSTATAVG